jgi:uncharacterized phage protein (TIGR02218 family)
MQAHLDTRATTLAWCWRITRTDNVKLGFTDHDKDLTFDGTTFEANAGFSGTEIAESLGLNVDHLEAESAFKSDHLAEEDLNAGLYDDATIEIWRVNWANVAQRVLMRKGSLGEVTRREGAFVAEMRGLAHYLNQEFGRRFQYACDADLGDARCGVNLTLATYKGTGTVLTAPSRQRFTASGLGSYTAEFFNGGLVTWTSGPNNGRKIEVMRHTLSGSTATIELWLPAGKTIGVGNTFTITAGCDKTFPTCKTKFNNALNYRGFPYIPGNDFMARYPKSEDPRDDGSSLFN